ncbi:MAG: type 1 glutamine amidotransferase domain-containing protein [Candidatus Acidiferrales bacterium]
MTQHDSRILMAVTSQVTIDFASGVLGSDIAPPWSDMAPSKSGEATAHDTIPMLGGKPMTGTWFSEFSEPYTVFREAGLHITVASPKGGPAPIDPRSYPEPSEMTKARDALLGVNGTERLETLNAADFDAIFVPGGHGPMFDLTTDPSLKRLLREFQRANKLISAVCHGPAGLLNVVLDDGSYLLRGRRVTGFSNREEAANVLYKYIPFSLQEALKKQGARYVEREPDESHVEVDDLLLTGQNPYSATALAKRVVEVLRAA